MQSSSDVAGASPRPLPRAPGLPVIGNLLEIATRTSYGGMTDLVRRYGTPLDVRFGKVVVVALARPEQVQHVLVERRGVYQKLAEIDPLRLLVGRGLFSSEGELWTSQRRLMQPHFTPKAVQRYAEDIRGAVGQMLARWQGRVRIEGLFESMRLAMDVVRRYSWSLLVDEVPAIGVSTLRPARPVPLALTDRRAASR